MNKYVKYNSERFFELFTSALGEKGRGASEILIQRYGSLDNVYSAEYGELEKLVGSVCATYVKVLAAVTSRRVTDSFKMGVPHSLAEIAEYFSSLLISSSVEVVYAMFISENDAVLDVRKISVGTVNASDITVRKIAEPAVSLGASRVILAHNHPGGEAMPSSEDVSLAQNISETLEYAGLCLEYMLIVSGSECYGFTASSVSKMEV